MTKTREERIAEWLGIYAEWDDDDSTTGCWILDNNLVWLPGPALALQAAIGEEGLIEWLASAEGEVAMERAVRAMGYYLISWADEEEEEEPWASVTIKTGYGDADKKYDSTSKDHNSALQEAILQMLGEEKKND